MSKIENEAKWSRCHCEGYGHDCENPPADLSGYCEACFTVCGVCGIDLEHGTHNEHVKGHEPMVENPHPWDPVMMKCVDCGAEMRVPRSTNAKNLWCVTCGARKFIPGFAENEKRGAQ